MGLLFLVVVALRFPAVVMAIAVRVCDRATERLLAVGNRIPPTPAASSSARAGRGGEWR
ncbi:hypothetical protein [Actinopolyspora xinjiangensis]|uniref:hypothetical protein n=1 Tax=Actinopolyspora xinjiangensis TaxID=405564 RepID=UPI001B8C3D03|nr:hypothetical protein [Actinopolyspora xinjiangensis]